jgi:hypothetical protein
MGAFMSANKMFVACALAAALGGCGLYVPEKNLVQEEVPEKEKGLISPEGRYENNLIALIKCETGQGLLKAYQAFPLPWLKSWGTAVTLTITALEQSSASPGVSSINPLGIPSSMQSFTAVFGATGSANATRTETIQFTYPNTQLMDFARQNITPGTSDCHQSAHLNGPGIEGDLKIGDFIYDKTVVAAFGNATTREPTLPLYNTFTEEITFVAAFGGNFTPTWKMIRWSADTSANLLSATRTKTNDLIITMGPIQTPIQRNVPVQLSSAAQSQHNARVQGSATATSSQSQTPTH